MLLPRVPPEYAPAVQYLCQVERLSASGRSGALRCAPELAASTLHQQIVLFGGGEEVLDVVHLDERATHVTFGKERFRPICHVLVAVVLNFSTRPLCTAGRLQPLPRSVDCSWHSSSLCCGRGRKAACECNMTDVFVTIMCYVAMCLYCRKQGGGQGWNGCASVSWRGSNLLATSKERRTPSSSQTLRR